MTRRTFPSPDVPARAGAGAWMIASSTLLLCGLAVADRTVAWMIGQFPASATLWELRFQYLRPISVFHDLAVRNLGDVSVVWFNLAVIAAALVIGLGALSGIRLIRALSSHLLLGAALVVAVYSFDFGEGIYAEVGAPSRSYLLVGGLMAAASAIMCLAAHADYVGLSPAMLRAARQVRRRLRRAGSEIGGIAIDSLVRLASGSKTVQTAPVHVLAAHRSRSTR